MTQATEKDNASLIERMFKAGAHFGYPKARRHPSMREALFGTKDRTDIIDLEKTGSFLAHARTFAKQCGKEGKTILFVGTKPEAKAAMRQAALSADTPFMVSKWVGGTLTNFAQIRKRVNRLLELREKKERGELSVYTRQEQRELEEEMEEITEQFGGIEKMDSIPDALFVIDPEYEDIAVHEAHKLNLPVVALASSDCNVSSIAYPVPGNDASKTSIELFADEIARAYADGKKEKEQEKKPAEANEADEK